jgi:hypothetical protein
MNVSIDASVKNVCPACGAADPPRYRFPESNILTCPQCALPAAKIKNLERRLRDKGADLI